jgi:DNA repair photolyase
VLVAPVIPGLTDHEVPTILAAAAAAGAVFAGYSLLRLPHAVGPLFEEWLSQHLPERKDKILNRVRAIRGGRLYDSRFGIRLKGEGIFAEQVAGLFAMARRRAGMPAESPRLSTAAFRRTSPGQLELFPS